MHHSCFYDNYCCLDLCASAIYLSPSICVEQAVLTVFGVHAQLGELAVLDVL